MARSTPPVPITPRASGMTAWPAGRVAPTLAALAALMLTTTARGADDPGYNKVVRPILRDACFVCHGPDSASRKADLRLDRRESAVEKKAIDPAHLSESELLARIVAEDPEEVMPPPSAHRQLTADEKGTIRRWVEAGAKYEPHWAFIPPARAEPPAVADPAWGRTAVDRFLRARIDASGLTPSAPADRRTLARRVTLDLTGLPPTPEQVEAFVHDEAPDAYEKLVDRLMASPAWGEHRGRYWLDAARYADTHGIHFDNYREVWSYRDWVIDAFNRNQPFDQFATEQLAGDLLPNRTLDQQVASGFNRCNITTNEGGAINEEYLVLYARDRTETASQVFLGLTTGCAVCHDHKFDPVSQKEFYELSAFFNNTTQAAMDGNIKDTPPTVFVPARPDRERWLALAGETKRVEGALAGRRDAVRPEFLAWLKGAMPKDVEATLPAQGLQLKARLDDRDVKAPARATLEVASAGDFEKDQAFSYGLWVKPATANMNGPLLARMDDGKDYTGWDLWTEGGRVATHIIHKWDGDALKVTSTGMLAANAWNHVFVTYDGSGKAAGVTIYIDGKAQATGPPVDRLKGSIRTEVPLKLAQRDRAVLADNAQFHDLRIYNRALPAAEVAALNQGGPALDAVAKAADARTDGDVDAAFRWFLASRDEPTRALRAELAKLEGEARELKGRGTVAHVMNERSEPASAYILFRGDYDKRRDQVGAATPAALPPMGPDLPRNRLGLARWLFRPEHPLTARVTVNRFWQELFGTGLVRTTGDFGLSGELPSDPELLDWLAVEFRESGWDVKRFFKMLVMTTAYQQSAVASPADIERDPANRLVARGPRYRMDAEMIRDYALFAGGLLVDKVGGPSVRPYQPDGVWEAVAMPESNTRNYKRDSGEKLYRRSMYTLWKRAAPPASMDLLNAPNRETCAVRRDRTNTPLQALVTLNDDQFVEAARHLAEVVLGVPDRSDGDRIEAMAGRLLGRPLRDAERAVIGRSLRDLAAYYGSHPDEAGQVIAVGESKPAGNLPTVELAAWTMLANELLNLDEVLNK